MPTERFIQIPLVYDGAFDKPPIGYVVLREDVLNQYEKGEEPVLNPIFQSYRVGHDGSMIVSLKKLRGFGLYTGKPEQDVGPPKPSEWATVWLCNKGHECVVSEEVYRTAIFRPRCDVRVDGDPCNATLIRRLRTYG